jgi:hypothetical protein
MEDANILLAEATLGRDAQEFFSSDLGRYVVGRCQAEISAAQDELSTVWPWRKNRIRDLQAKIWRARTVVGWLGDLVTNGRSAEEILESELNND